MKKALTFLLCSIAFYCLSQNNKLFENANTLYNEGKYDEAVKTYEQILTSDMHSAEVYFNLANAHYKLNNIGPSIYYYEQALRLKPKDKDILNNLRFAQNMTVDAIDTVPTVGFSRLFNNIITMASSDTWAILAISGVFIFVLLFLFYHFSYATTQKRIAFVVSLFSFFFAGFSFMMAFQKIRLDNMDNPAIVYVQEARIKADPNKISEELFRLHEGTKVQVLETYNDWYKIEIADKTTGWLPKDRVKTLK